MNVMPRLTKQQFRELREELGWTQAQLARAMQLGENGRRTVRRWETEATPREDGQPRVGHAIPGSAEIALRALAGQDLDYFRALAEQDDTSQE